MHAVAGKLLISDGQVAGAAKTYALTHCLTPGPALAPGPSPNGRGENWSLQRIGQRA